MSFYIRSIRFCMKEISSMTLWEILRRNLNENGKIAGWYGSFLLLYWHILHEQLQKILGETTSEQVFAPFAHTARSGYECMHKRKIIVNRQVEQDKQIEGYTSIICARRDVACLSNCNLSSE